MPFHRNFIYYIDKRRWKYYFLVVSLCEGNGIPLQP
jgi:hypothetical protein